MVALHISVIVPVYNVENYLIKCVNSILAQNLQQYELLLIDDGSTDSSGQICDQLAEKYDEIQVIHQKNGGLSAARNTGLKFAKGKYILFVDSDDMLCNNAIPALIDLCEEQELDVLCANYCDAYDDGSESPSSIIPVELYNTVSGIDAFKEMFNNNSVQMMVWMNIYRREFLINENLFFPEGLNHEDEYWTPRVLIAAKKVQCRTDVIYRYLHRKNSISKDDTSKKKNCMDTIRVCYANKSEIQNLSDKTLRYMYEDYLATIFLSAVSHGKLVEKEFSDLVNSSYLKGLHLGAKNKTKAFLFAFNKRLYCFVAKILK